MQIWGGYPNFPLNESWGDMTGLIPAGSPEKDQRGAYQELYPYLPEGEIKEERDS